MSDDLLFEEDKAPNEEGDFLFAQEQNEQETELELEPWVIAVVDDDQQVHDVTKMALKHFKFDNRNIEFIHAFSGEEGKALFEQHDDIALCLLDVVMESEHAGLDVVKYVRENLNNRFTRIVLRTGQPGQAPEEEVISNYDINDYKEKTELTRGKLVTLLYSCLRSYRDIVSLDQNRRGLERVIQASAEVFSSDFLEQFAQGVLQQVTSILQMDENAFYGKCDGLAAHEDEHSIKVIAGTGIFFDAVGDNAAERLPQEFIDQLLTQDKDILSFHTQDAYMCSIFGKDKRQNVLYLKGIRKRSGLEQNLLDIFSRNVLIAFENLFLKNEIESSQSELIEILGQAIKSKCKETSSHVKRVAKISHFLAIKLELSPNHAQLICDASPLHDLGKISIPTEILNKPAKLNEDEMEIMKQHAIFGYEMLNKSNKKLLITAAKIAKDHHEYWDGSGYPEGKAKENISIEGRITAIADVYDALMSKRCYKEPWKESDVLDYLKQQSGLQFEPTIVDVFLENINDIKSIADKHPD